MASRAQRLAEFVCDRRPAIDAEVEVLCEDHVGTYTVPYACRWTAEGWTNARTGALLTAEVLGWREIPPAAGAGRTPDVP